MTIKIFIKSVQCGMKRLYTLTMDKFLSGGLVIRCTSLTANCYLQIIKTISDE